MRVKVAVTRIVKLAIAVVWLVPPILHAGYVKYGTGILAIENRTIDNGALSIQTSNTWLATTPATLPYTCQVSFSLPPCDGIAAARLYMTVWGGTAAYTCNLDVSLNGSTNPIASIAMGTTNDANPTFNATTSCVYGTDSGIWLVTVPVPVGQLSTNGLSTLVSAVVSDPANKFDGRLIHITLVAVYRQANLFNRFSYALAEGSGNIYSNTVGATNSLSVAIGPVETNDLLAAGLTALYSYGDYGQNDRLYVNGVQYGTDDVANHQKNNTAWSQVADLANFAVTNVAASNVVRFTCNPAEIAGKCEASLRPHAVFLGLTREPEFRIARCAQSGNQAATFDWPGTTAHTYMVEFSTNLLFANGWHTLSGYTNLAGSNGWMHCTDQAGEAARFYRVKKQ